MVIRTLIYTGNANPKDETHLKNLNMDANHKFVVLVVNISHYSHSKVLHIKVLFLTLKRIISFFSMYKYLHKI